MLHCCLSYRACDPVVSFKSMSPEEDTQAPMIVCSGFMSQRTSGPHLPKISWYFNLGGFYLHTSFVLHLPAHAPPEKSFSSAPHHRSCLSFLIEFTRYLSLPSTQLVPNLQFNVYQTSLEYYFNFIFMLISHNPGHRLLALCNPRIMSSASQLMAELFRRRVKCQLLPRW